ncbi:hypothetical protein EH2_04074 [Bacillus subtilis]|nr:hypothetical protein EH2_04074 [Bacillus subtilis]
MYNGVEQLFALISRCRPIYKSVKAPTAFNPFPHRKSLPLPTARSLIDAFPLFTDAQTMISHLS